MKKAVLRLNLAIQLKDRPQIPLVSVGREWQGFLPAIDAGELVVAEM
jgi:hypothetical protein